MSVAPAEIAPADARERPARQLPFHALCAVCVLLMVPGLLVGPIYDDWFHAYDAAAPEHGWWRRLFGLYEFFGAAQVSEARAHGFLPWWSDDGLTISFLRPLSSLLLALNHQLLDGGGFLSHLHALLWYLAVLWAAWRVLMLLFGAAVARWATLLYALSAVHVMPLAFVAALHSHVTTFFALLSLECLIRAARGAAQLRLWALLWYALALAGGESAIVLLPIAGALLWSELGLRRALVVLAPQLALTLLIGALYFALGYGSHHSSAYLQPGSAAFFEQLVPRWLVLNGGLLASFPPDLWLFGAQPVQVAAGVVGLVLAALVLRGLLSELEPPARSRLLALSGGALLSLVAMTSGIPGGRLLLLPALIAAAVFALAGRRAARLWRGGRRGRALLLGAWVAVFGIGLNPLFRALVPRDLARVGETLPLQARAVAQQCRGATALAVGAADSNAAYLNGLFLQLPEAERPRVLHLISMAPGKHRLSQTSEGTFQLDIEGDLLGLPWARIYRDTPIPVPFRQALPGVEVQVQEASERGARLTLHTPPADSRCWITVEKGTFIPLQPRSGSPIEWTPSREGQ